MSITIQTLIEKSNKPAREKGWWDDENRNIGELVALIHSEVSEALEAYRIKGRDGISESWFSESGKPEGFVYELADVLIRVADLCGEFKLDLEGALESKLAYNETRPYRHGDKKA